MVEDAQPKSLIAYRQIEAKFGPERTMAKTIAAEYDRSASSRKRLWPLAFSILAIGLMWAPTPLSQWAGSYQFWSHIFWTLTTAGFIVLGFLARKPSLGQFAALAAGWIVVGTAWAATTCYPVVDSPREGGRQSNDAIVLVGRSETGEFVAQLNKNISNDFEAVERMKEGKETFAPGAKQSVPSFLTYNGQYLVPEGLREVTMGIPPAKLHTSLLTPSWDKAVKAWNGPKMYVFGQGKNVSERMDEATVEIKRSPLEAARWQRSIDYLNWIRRQPLSVQLPLDFQMVSLIAVGAVGIACLLTNLGWLFWLLYRSGRRAYLRRSLGGGPGGVVA
jgi:hypothetical protein